MFCALTPNGLKHSQLASPSSSSHSQLQTDNSMMSFLVIARKYPANIEQQYYFQLEASSIKAMVKICHWYVLIWSDGHAHSTDYLWPVIIEQRADLSKQERVEESYYRRQQKNLPLIPSYNDLQPALVSSTCLTCCLHRKILAEIRYQKFPCF